MPDTPPNKLSPRHMIALRLIYAGLSIGEAAAAIGLSAHRMQFIARCGPGAEYIRHLQALSDNYAAIMVALGITPGDIARAVDGGSYHKRPSRRQRKASYTPRTSLANDD